MMISDGDFFMKKTMTFHRKKIWMVFLVCALMLLGLVGRLVYLMGVRSDYYYQKAEELHERERVIKAARGQILDAKGRILADNKTVCTISVIHSQIKDPQKVIEVLSKELEIDTDTVRKKVEKISSIQYILPFSLLFSLILSNTHFAFHFLHLRFLTFSDKF